MTTSTISEVQLSFLQAIKEQSRSQQSIQLEWWRQRLFTETEDPRCTYCEGPVSSVNTSNDRQRARFDLLVPLAHGGPKDADNLVMACQRCRKDRRSTDLLLWRPTSELTGSREHLLEKRRAVLAMSHNHLIREHSDGRKKATVAKLLERRLSHPRVAVRAAHTDSVGLIAFSAIGVIPDELVAMVRSMGAWPFAPHAFQLAPHRFHDAIWALIEHNALVHRIDLPDYPEPAPSGSGDAPWHVTLRSVLDIRRGRPKIKPVRRPKIERPMDWGQRLLIEYQASGEQGRPFDWAWVNSHKETDAGWSRERRAEARRQSAELSRALGLITDHSPQSFIDELDRRLAQRPHVPGVEDTLARLALEHGIAS